MDHETYKEQIWKYHHYRFGLAGEGQADIIERYLRRKLGRVLDIGCGPFKQQVVNLALHSALLIAADTSLKGKPIADPPPNICFLATDARSLCLADGSIDHIVALGLFACIRESQTPTVFGEFFRICRPGGLLMLTNAVRHPKESYSQLASETGFRLLGL